MNIVAENLSYYVIGRRPFALRRRPDGLPWKAVGYDFTQQALVIDPHLFFLADTDPDVEEIDEQEFWRQLRDIGCRDRRINW